MMLRVDSLSKHYGKLKAVNGISFSVDEGEIFALLGPNGAGKTSTIKCILGLRKPSGGKISLCGRAAYLPEEKQLYENLRIWKMIKLASWYTQDFAEKKAIKLAEDFGLNSREKISNLSHGMKTLLYLALVLAQDADIYIFDEPTWGLDPLMRSKVLDMIKELSFQQKSVLYTSHILPEVEKVAQKVAIMNKGKILEMGELDDIKEKYVAVVTGKGEKMKDGWLYKETESEKVYVVKREDCPDGEAATFEMIFEALVKGREDV